MLVVIFKLCSFPHLRYKSGLIAVLNVDANDGRISMMNKLQGHSSEIHSLAWCPTPKDYIDFGNLGMTNVVISYI